MLAGIQQKPVGVFWDLQNCSVPKNKSPSDVIAYIRNFFIFNRLNHREYDFVISCDVTILRKDVPEDINKAGGVTLSHVNGSSKNAADEKLRENMKKFVDTHASYASPVLILISGDIDFVNDLRGYQTRLGCTIVVIHSENCSAHFKVGWNETYSFKTFCSAVKDNPAANSAEYLKRKENTKNKSGQQNQSGQPSAKNQGGQPTYKKNQPDQKSFPPSQPVNETEKARRPAQFNQKTNPQNRANDLLASHQPSRVSSKQQGQHFPGPMQNQGGPIPLLRQHQSQQNFPVSPQHRGQFMFDTSQFHDQHFADNWEQHGQYMSVFSQNQDQAISAPRQRLDPNFAVHREHHGRSTSASRQHAGLPIPAPRQFQGQPIAPPLQQKRPQFHHENKSGPQTHVSNENLRNNQQHPPIDITTVPTADKPVSKKFILMVGGLPGKMDFQILREKLQSEADKVHGRVKFVKNGQGFITFKNKTNADRAVELFNGVQVFGKTLRVSFTKSIPFEDRANEKPKSEPNGFKLAKKANPAGPSTSKKHDANNATDNQPLSGSNGNVNTDPVLAGLGTIIDGIVANRIAATNPDNKTPDSCSIQ